MFKNRKVVIASMHGKESVIGPLVQKHLGLLPIVADINTDSLGTFSGEIERTKSPYETALQKCQIAMDATGCDIAIASEGSFGSHPTLFFARADDELILMVDRKNNVEFFGRELTTDTNFSGQEVNSLEEALEFANKVKFPEHAVILKDKEINFNKVVKGVNTETFFKDQIARFLEQFGSLWIETDMRAMNNPTRMSVIEKATKNLLEKVQSLCPKCSFPGFWVTEVIPGLPCSLCSLPTKSTRALKHSCKRCDHFKIEENPNSKTHEDPQFCDYCNP
jgi:hypothetical protein